MAAERNNPAYGTGVYGSLAYDYGKALPRRDRPVDRQVIIPAPPRIREQERIAAHRVKTRQSISPMAIIGTACAAALLVFTLMARIQLTEVTDTAAHLEQQLIELEVAQNRLLIDYERAFNLTEIEEYATRELGMQRPRDEQIHYLSSTVPDKAMILSGESEGRDFGDRLFDTLSSIAEYFR